MTNLMSNMVYDRLVRRDKKLGIVPALATEWQQTAPLTWRFKLRPGVKFHDGTPFTADDVVFSIERAAQPTSQIVAYAKALGTPKKIDDLTVEFNLAAANPIFLQHLELLFIMSKSWSEKNKATKPLDFKNKEELYTALHANGTGPYILESRQPGIKTVHKRNPNWWDKHEGNVQEVVFTPIANDATRTSALVSGELDFVLDPASRDVARLRNTSGVKVVDGPENRIVFIGMDQQRDTLLYGNAGGKNPFKDQRVRRALYQAIDIEAIKTKLMNGQSVPSGGSTPSPIAAYNDPALESRLPFDLAGARKLMADAGYPEGFEVTLDCPNNRYINDEEICIALSAMWAQLKVKVKVNAMPRVTYFPKLDKFDTSMYMLGWGGSITDAEPSITPLMKTSDAAKGQGAFNYGRVSNPKIDQLGGQSSVEADPKKREALVKATLAEWKEQVHTIPLHRQVIPWAMRSNISVTHRPDNYLTVEWVTVGPK